MPDHASTSTGGPRNRTDPGARTSFGLGMTMLFAAAGLWSLSGALIKLINSRGEGPDGLTIAFYRSLFAGLALLPLARGRWATVGVRDEPAARAAGAARSWPRIRPAALNCVVFFTLMTACFVIANTRTAAANAIILQYTSTFWVFLLSPLVVRERPQSSDVATFAVAMFGVATIFAGNAAGGADLPALVMALLAGLFFGLLTLMIRLLRDVHPAVVVVLNNLGSAALLLLPTVRWGDPVVTGRELMLLIILGVVQFGVPYYLYTLGLARVPAHQAALVTMLEPVLVPVWAFLAVRDPVPFWTLIGGSMILVALGAFGYRATRTTAVPAC